MRRVMITTSKFQQNQNYRTEKMMSPVPEMAQLRIPANEKFPRQIKRTHRDSLSFVKFAQVNSTTCPIPGGIYGCNHCLHPQQISKILTSHKTIFMCGKTAKELNHCSASPHSACHLRWFSPHFAPSHTNTHNPPGKL